MSDTESEGEQKPPVTQKKRNDDDDDDDDSDDDDATKSSRSRRWASAKNSAPRASGWDGLAASPIQINPSRTR